MDLFKIGFITVRLVDIVDISIVTYLFYKLYELLRGSVALRIFSAILVVFLLWKLVDLMNMHLLRSILDQFLGVGAIALIVLFAPEIRRVLMILMKNTFLDRITRQLRFGVAAQDFSVNEILAAVESIKNTGAGALIVLTGSDSLEQLKETGDKIDAEISERIIASIFLPYSPLHDGAVILDGNRVSAARCVLPITDNPRIPPELGMRHRSALGLSEVSDALVIVISEERNEISIAQEGNLQRNIDVFALENAILSHYHVGIKKN